MAVQPRRSTGPGARRSAGTALTLPDSGPPSPDSRNGSRGSSPQARDMRQLAGGEADGVKPSRGSAVAPFDHLLQMEDHDEEEKMGRVPLIGDQRMKIDDEDATYVIVFPRSKDEGGTVDPKAVRENPRADWEKIFKQGHHRGRFPRGRMGEDRFQEAARRTFLDLVKDSGMKASAMSSVDEDEVFLKLSLDREGQAIRKLAKRFQYRLPFKTSCYEELSRIGSYQGGRAMKNEEGETVVAYREYHEKLEHKLQPFRRIDEIRLIQMQLEFHVSLHDMKQQNIISAHFPGAEYETVRKLNAEWADWTNICLIPSQSSEREVRGYFGEEIALFFRWTGLYTRMLGLLSIVSLCAQASYLPDLGLSMAAKDNVKLGFGVMIVIWETYFQKLNSASSARAVQCWGMDHFESIEPALPSFDPSMEGTQALAIRKMFAASAVLVYMSLFVAVIFYLNAWFHNMALEGHTRFAAWQSTSVSVLIKVLSFVWRKIAELLVKMQNHRTQSRFNDALMLDLALVKLFVALWPFFYSSALRQYDEVTCAPDLSGAAHKIYGSMGWPPGVAVSIPAESQDYIPVTELDFLRPYWFIRPNNKEGTNMTCISGCYPVSCDDSAVGGEHMDARCQTNCVQDMLQSLQTLYVIQLISCSVFVLVPIVLTRWSVQKEMKRAEKLRRGGRDKAVYSFIQFQAKCHKEAPYEFSSWGGSYVEDFLDLSVTYALLSCFGMCYPLMAIIGFVCMLIQYRLLAYRMANVTCRPEPRGSAGIGLMGDIFEGLSVFSVFFSVLIGVLTMLPMRQKPFYMKLVTFILVEKALHIVRGVISYLIPSTPPEVTLIEDYNAEFEKAVAGNHNPAAGGPTKRYTNVDVGLRRRGYDTSRDGSTTDSDGADSANGLC